MLNLIEIIKDYPGLGVLTIDIWPAPSTYPHRAAPSSSLSALNHYLYHISKSILGKKAISSEKLVAGDALAML
jgi:hypothetical protein